MITISSPVQRHGATVTIVAGTPATTAAHDWAQDEG
jgi:hypothetical protein